MHPGHMRQNPTAAHRSALDGTRLNVRPCGTKVFDALMRSRTALRMDYYAVTGVLVISARGNRAPDTELREHLRELAAAHPRWGMPRLFWLLRREGRPDNYKRV